jgi:rare lipoprotein A (peptidoglycan hydrolase)
VSTSSTQRLRQSRHAPRRAIAIACGAFALLGLACCTNESVSTGPRHPARSETSRASNGPPNGCTPAELKQPARKVIRGLATYYADSLAGNHTANGERYDPHVLSAAHLSLPFGTRLRVTRTDMRSSPIVCVRVNDRGPYGNSSHILDLSRRAADRLRMIRAGVVPVNIDVL